MLLQIESSQNSLYTQTFCLPHLPPKAPILYGLFCLGPICPASGPDPDFISFHGHLTGISMCRNEAFKLKDT